MNATLDSFYVNLRKLTSDTASSAHFLFLYGFLTLFQTHDVTQQSADDQHVVAEDSKTLENQAKTTEQQDISREQLMESDDQLIKSGAADHELIDNAFRRRPAGFSPGYLGQVRPVSLPVPVVLPGLITEPSSTTTTTTTSTTTTPRPKTVRIKTTTTTAAPITTIWMDTAVTTVSTQPSTLSTATMPSSTTSTTPRPTITTHLPSNQNNTVVITGEVFVPPEGSTVRPSTAAFTAKPLNAVNPVIPTAVATAASAQAAPPTPIRSIPWYPAVPQLATQSAGGPPRLLRPPAQGQPQVYIPQSAAPGAPLADRNDNNRGVAAASASGSGYATTAAAEPNRVIYRQPGESSPGYAADPGRVTYRQPADSPGFVQTVGQTALDVAKRLFSWPF